MERQPRPPQIENVAVAYELAHIENSYRDLAERTRAIGLEDVAQIAERQMGGVLMRAQFRLENPANEMPVESARPRRHSIRSHRLKGLGRHAKGRQITP